MVRVYANFAGLSRKLVRVGINGSVNDLAVFASGFTCSQPLFDFVDAGYGKEGADYKIKGTYLVYQEILISAYMPLILQSFSICLLAAPNASISSSEDVMTWDTYRCSRHIRATFHG